jgi:hypothetical protein
MDWYMLSRFNSFRIPNDQITTTMTNRKINTINIGSQGTSQGIGK